VTPQISELYRLAAISCGNILKETLGNTQSGDPCYPYKDCLAKGDRIPDDYVNNLMYQRLTQPDVKALGFVLDGYPRTEDQFKFMRNELNLDPEIVILVDYPDEVITSSYKEQKLDPNTGRIYSARSVKAIRSPTVASRLKELPKQSDYIIKKR